MFTKSVLQFLLFILFTNFVQTIYAQKIRVINNKGTIETINNNKVTTSNTEPTDPVEGDVWFTANTPSTIKIYDDVDDWITIREHFLFDAFDNAGGQTINTTFSKLNINTTRVNIGSFTIASNDITIPKTGYYEITYSATFTQNDNTNAGAITELLLDGLKIIGSDLYSYNKTSLVNIEKSSKTIVSGTKTLILNHTDITKKISLQSKIVSGSSTLTTVANATSITIKNLD